MPIIELCNISKYVCKNINLKILNNEFTVLLGPNGAGKSTLLNIIAGLIEYQGSVLFDGKCVNHFPVNKRKIGYLFQDLYLFPHLDVFSNIAYSLEIRKKNSHKIRERVNELLEMLRIENLLHCYPKQLSGGEKQRVALARSLATKPDILLLDEPLSSVDLQSSKYLRRELKQLQKELGITTIYVTHNLMEAEEMADKIVVIDKGKVEQIGGVKEIFFSPVNKQVSEFIGAPNILKCSKYKNLGKGIAEVNCGGLSVIIPDEGRAINKIAMLPRDIYCSELRPPGPKVNRFKGSIIDIYSNIEVIRLKLKVGENILLAELPYHIFARMNLKIGKEIFIILKLRTIKCL